MRERCRGRQYSAERWQAHQGLVRTVRSKLMLLRLIIIRLIAIFRFQPPQAVRLWLSGQLMAMIWPHGADLAGRVQATAASFEKDEGLPRWSKRDE